MSRSTLFHVPHRILQTVPRAKNAPDSSAARAEAANNNSRAGPQNRCAMYPVAPEIRTSSGIPASIASQQFFAQIKKAPENQKKRRDEMELHDINRPNRTISASRRKNLATSGFDPQKPGGPGKKPARRARHLLKIPVSMVCINLGDQA